MATEAQAPEATGRMYDTLEFKAQVIRYVQRHRKTESMTSIANKFAIKRPTLYAWIKQRKEIAQAVDARRRVMRMQHYTGPNAAFEPHILRFMRKAELSKEPIRKIDILSHCDHLIPDFDCKSRTAKYSWLRRFFLRHGIGS